MKQGWISVHRQLEDHWLWEDKPYAKGQAWIDLLMLANHKDRKIPYKGEIITCKSGDVNRSILELSKRWGWSRDKTRKFLNLLESDGMVTVKATRHRTTITIENYEFYRYEPTTKRQQGNQGCSKDCGESSKKHTTSNTTKTIENCKVSPDKPATKQQQNGNQPTTSRQPADINNNVNNVNNIIYNADPQLDKAIKEFIKFRKEIKKPMTDHAIELLTNKLNKLSSDTSEQIEILNQSMLNGWQGVFPLKESGKKPKETTIDESKNDLDDLF